jgi:hypothetical protein
MEGYCSTGQSPQWAVAPKEEEEEEDEEEKEEEDNFKTHFHLNCIAKFISFIKENTVRVHYIHGMINTV